MNKEIPLLSVGDVNRLANEILSELTVRVVGELDDRFNTNRGYGIGRLSDADASIGIYIPGKILKENEEYLKPGQKIVAQGRLGIFEKYGKFSLTVSAVEPHGEGILQQELEKRKRKLAKLGYFDLERKRRLPDFPLKIGVITASNSAAWNDFKKHVISEYAGLTIYLHDAKMQGAYCIDSVISAFKRLAKKKLDILVLTRGGGSLQELMPFNSQEIVEAIAESQVPVITAIGHEIDITLADLAADIFVSTPTKAAEIISGKHAEFKNALERIAYDLQRVKLLYKNLPVELTNERKRLYNGIKLLFKEKKNMLADAFSQLELLSPKGTLKRGYSITFDKNGKIVKNIKSLKRKDLVRTRLFRGEFSSIVQ